MKILVTGGAGYIGSHTCVELLNNGYEVVVADNLSNASPVALDRVREITGKDLTFARADIRSRQEMDRIFADHAIDAVIHFAGLKAVGESISVPLTYYDNNISGTLSLLGAMAAAGVKKLIFSSSATVYGNPASLPITEDFPLSVTNPYGRTKLMIEEILKDLFTGDPQWQIALLRYFNPVGAHPSGRIGEDPNGIPDNLMPYVAQVAVGKLARVQVFGNDYDTGDGTGVRDYIHVTDLAAAHVLALEALMGEPGRSLTMNCGYGRGFSVLEVLDAVDRVTNRVIERRIAPRRAGDPDSLIADNSRIRATLPWSPRYADLETIVTHALAWERKLGEIRG